MHQKSAIVQSYIACRRQSLIRPSTAWSLDSHLSRAAMHTSISARSAASATPAVAGAPRRANVRACAAATEKAANGATTAAMTAPPPRPKARLHMQPRPLQALVIFTRACHNPCTTLPRRRPGCQRARQSSGHRCAFMCLTACNRWWGTCAQPNYPGTAALHLMATNFFAAPTTAGPSLPPTPQSAQRDLPHQHP